MTVPQNPKIYHITHIDNLSDILSSGYLYSDAERIRLGINHNNIGMSEIKRRRLEELYLPYYPDISVGGCVPFYFCPRSIMLYLLYMQNHPDITYCGKQSEILHLEFCISQVTVWANANNNVPWVFTDSNAGAYTARYYNELDGLNELNWDDIYNSDFRNASTKHNKQAEFLIYKQIPVSLIDKIGVQNPNIQERVNHIIRQFNRRISVTVEKNWYY